MTALASLAGLRALVVDDSADSANALQMLLMLHGAQAEAAYDGSTAIERLLAWQPEFALIDIELPGITGLEIAARVREQSWGHRMVLLAVSGWAREEDHMRSYAAGFNAHVVKPVNLDSLFQLIHTALGLVQQGAGTTPWVETSAREGGAVISLPTGSAGSA